MRIILARFEQCRNPDRRAFQDWAHLTVGKYDREMGETEILAVDDPGAGLEARRRRVPDYPIHLGPATHLAEERTRLHGLPWQHLDDRMLRDPRGAV